MPCGFQLVELVKFFIVGQEIWGSILVYTKNRLISWYNDKELSSRADTIN